jgi:hypothetical protein
LLQDYRPLEIDVSDNSPDDQTQRLISSITPPAGVTLRYWRNDPPGGSIDNTRKLFAEARGARLIVVHDDDALLPGAVSALDEAYQMAPDVIAAYGTPVVVDERGEEIAHETERDNLSSNRTPKHVGVRRDILTCALWRQMPVNGFLISTEAVRRIGYRSRAEIGLAVDTDFEIRLACAYKGSAAFVFIDRPVSQYRLAPTSQRFTESDTCWKLYDEIVGMRDLASDEEDARDWLLAQIARAAVIEHAVARRRGAALRIFLSRHYPRPEGLGRTIYAVGLLVMPRTFRLIRKYVGLINPRFVALPPVRSTPWLPRSVRASARSAN